jgi:hypothetical protein
MTPHQIRTLQEIRRKAAKMEARAHGRIATSVGASLAEVEVMRAEWADAMAIQDLANGLLESSLASALEHSLAALPPKSSTGNGPPSGVQLLAGAPVLGAGK